MNYIRIIFLYCSIKINVALFSNKEMRNKKSIIVTDIIFPIILVVILSLDVAFASTFGGAFIFITGVTIYGILYIVIKSKNIRALVSICYTSAFIYLFLNFNCASIDQTNQYAELIPIGSCRSGGQHRIELVLSAFEAVIDSGNDKEITKNKSFDALIDAERSLRKLDIYYSDSDSISKLAFVHRFTEALNDGDAEELTIIKNESDRDDVKKYLGIETSILSGKINRSSLSKEYDEFYGEINMRYDREEYDNRKIIEFLRNHTDKVVYLNIALDFTYRWTLSDIGSKCNITNRRLTAEHKKQYAKSYIPHLFDGEVDGVTMALPSDTGSGSDTESCSDNLIFMTLNHRKVSTTHAGFGIDYVDIKGFFRVTKAMRFKTYFYTLYEVDVPTATRLIYENDHVDDDESSPEAASPAVPGGIPPFTLDSK